MFYSLEGGKEEVLKEDGWMVGQNHYGHYGHYGQNNQNNQNNQNSWSSQNTHSSCYCNL